LATGLPFDGTKAWNILIVEQPFRRGIPERPDHRRKVFLSREYRKRNGPRQAQAGASYTAPPSFPKARRTK
jgi:hypothetical protein